MTTTSTTATGSGTSSHNGLPQPANVPGTQQTKIAQVLIPVDGSNCALETLAWASRIFDKHSTRFFLLTVIPSTPTIPLADFEVPQAQEILKLAQDTLEKEGYKVAMSNYVVGDPVHQICAYADENHMDQVFMGSHGRSGLSKVLLGSVSSGVLEHAKCPVMVYRNIRR